MQPHLTAQGLSTLIILGAAILLLVTNRTRPDVVGLLVLASLGVSKVLTPEEAFASFSSPPVVTIVAVLVMAQGLYATGAAARVGDLLAKLAGTTERSLVAFVMTSGAFLSLFMNNIAAASVLLPAVTTTAQQRRVYPSRLLLPLAYATTLGGAATLFTTVNIVMSGLLRERGIRGFGVLDFLPMGFIVAATGIVYMVVWGRRQLPMQSQAQRVAASGGGAGTDLAEVYQLNERVFRARIPVGSKLHGRPLSESGLREDFNVNVIAIESADAPVLAPPPETELKTGDVLVMSGVVDEFRAKDIEPYLEILPQRSIHTSDLESPDIVVAEIVLAPRSSLIGKTLRDLNLRSKYGFTVVAIWRQGRPIRRGMAGLPLQFGDALLIQGTRERLPVLHAERDFILLSGEHPTHYVSRPGRMWMAVGITALTFLSAATGLFPTTESLLAGGLLMVVTGCITIDEAYATIEWKSVFLVAGMLALALALTKTGAAAVMASRIVAFAGAHTAHGSAFGSIGIVAVLFAATALLVQALGGPAVAAIVGPLALQAADQLSLAPRSVAMAIALACSMAFVSPLAHPVNVLVMAPGGYTFRDFAKVGIPLTLLLTIVVLVTLPIVWPLAP